MPRWVETAKGDRAILIREAKNGACLIRYADRRGGYAWTSRAALTPRPDLAHQPDPDWLAKARVSRRPDRALWPLLHDDDDPPARPPFDFETDADGRPLN